MRAFETEKTDVAEVDRSIYDIKDAANAAFEVSSGLTPEIVEKISEEKHDPEWMRIFRLKALETYNKMPVQNCGPSIAGLDMSNIVTYVRPNTEMRGKWSEVPDDIKNTFERLGIPQAERASLAGVGAQYDSEVVYHNVKAEVAAQGVVYTDMESALTGPYAEMVRKHFMKLVPPTDHKFAALHGAVWSGGSFVYVPAGVHVEIPLQSYFRLNAPGAGQFEHTLIIVDKGAYLHFIEGCSAPKYNVANLHAGCVEIFVGEGAHVKLVQVQLLGNNASRWGAVAIQQAASSRVEQVRIELGGKVSVCGTRTLQDHNKSEYDLDAVYFGRDNDVLDYNDVSVQIGKDTLCEMHTAGVLTGNADKILRGTVDFRRGAKRGVGHESEDVLMFSPTARNRTAPLILCGEEEVEGQHAASVGRLDESKLYYLRSRGLSESQARRLMVDARFAPAIEKIPLEELRTEVRETVARRLDDEQLDG